MRPQPDRRRMTPRMWRTTPARSLTSSSRPAMSRVDLTGRRFHSALLACLTRVAGGAPRIAARAEAVFATQLTICEQHRMLSCRGRARKRRVLIGYARRRLTRSTASTQAVGLQSFFSAKVAELADAPDLGSGSRKAIGGSTPPFRIPSLPCRERACPPERAARRWELRSAGTARVGQNRKQARSGTPGARSGAGRWAPASDEPGGVQGPPPFKQ